MSDIAFCLMLLGVSAGLLALAFFVSQSAYQNGFWDGVLWERERGGRIFLEDAPGYVPGCESTYPSKPGPSWHGWKSLADGARRRELADHDRDYA